MSGSQIVVLALAILAAFGALFGVRLFLNRPDAPAAANQEPEVQVLVAARDLPIGTALTAGDVAWRPWTKAAVAPTFIVSTSNPQGREDIAGGVVRTAMVAGEPIVTDRVVKPGDRGFMAAVLRPGYRAVGLKVTPETATGGFVMPGDHVDVILTRQVDTPAPGGSRKETRVATLLADVPVLAVGDKFRRPEGSANPEPIKAESVTLELSADDAEVLMQGQQIGELSLSLRSVQDAELSVSRTASKLAAAGEVLIPAQIRVHQFGEVSTESVSRTPGGF
jgi:pilus assembly protein CpaB